MIMAGASAVQIYSAAHLEGLRGLGEYNYESIDQIRGILLPKLLRQDQMKKIIPEWNEKTCIRCKNCRNICLENAIDCIERPRNQRWGHDPKGIYNHASCTKQIPIFKVYKELKFYPLGDIFGVEKSEKNSDGCE